MKSARYKRWVANVTILLFSITSAFVLGEGLLRWIDGYELFSIKLSKNNNTNPFLRQKIGFTATNAYTLDQFVKDFKFIPDVNPQWIYLSPESRRKFKVLPEHRARYDQYNRNPKVNYLWNDYFIDRYYHDTGKSEARFLRASFPKELYLFNVPWKTVFPHYRYPTNVTLPSGLTTNQFGWRGSDIALNKPEKTIRLACVGASTTVDNHGSPFSYPEFIEHWLNLWSQQNDYGIKFEVINSAREGTNSNDFTAIVHYELLPMDLDYLIYYEGSNQFNTPSMVKYPFYVKFGQPPEGLIPNFNNIESKDKSWLDILSQYTVVAERVRSGIEAWAITGQEPPKPEQVFYLPEGLDEMKPDREHLGNTLNLNVILKDLDQIKRDADSRNIKMLLATFDWFVYDGMVLDPIRHRGTYVYLNRVFWPINYKNMRRMADFQNRVFKMWAEENQIDLIDVAGLMPRKPDLYIDAIHNVPLGTRIRAWINFQAIIPIIKRDIETKTVPRLDQDLLAEHPYIKPGYTRVMEN
jgi:hypothetical protein